MKLLLSFQGRLNRGLFWAITCCTSAVFWAVVIQTLKFEGGLDERSLFVIAVLAVGGGWINLAAAVRRLHDIDRSAWRILIFYALPVILSQVGRATYPAGLTLILAGIAITLWGVTELGFLPGSPGTNRFGANPREAQPHPLMIGLMSASILAIAFIAISVNERIRPAQEATVSNLASATADVVEKDFASHIADPLSTPERAAVFLGNVGRAQLPDSPHPTTSSGVPAGATEQRAAVFYAAAELRASDYATGFAFGERNMSEARCKHAPGAWRDGCIAGIGTRKKLDPCMQPPPPWEPDACRKQGRYQLGSVAEYKREWLDAYREAYATRQNDCGNGAAPGNDGCRAGATARAQVER